MNKVILQLSKLQNVADKINKKDHVWSTLIETRSTIACNWLSKTVRENLRCVTKNEPFAIGRFSSTIHFDAEYSLLGRDQVSSYLKQSGAYSKG